MHALCAALDEARTARGLTWADLVAELNAPFKFVPSIPTSLSTIRGMGGKSSVTSLRFDTKGLHAALDEVRRERGLTWRQVAAELPGFKEGMLTNLATGPAIGFPRVMRVTQWLGRPAADFTRGYDW
jgi:hypothetical protein